MMTGCFHISFKRVASTRPIASVGPPAAGPISSRTGFDGYPDAGAAVSGCAGQAVVAPNARTASPNLHPMLPLRKMRSTLVCNQRAGLRAMMRIITRTRIADALRHRARWNPLVLRRDRQRYADRVRARVFRRSAKLGTAGASLSPALSL